MRPGPTKTTSVSLDATTPTDLEALAQRHHQGKVSALAAEIASQFTAAEAYFEKYAVPELDETELATIETEWSGQQKPQVKPRRSGGAA